ncbi:hypothetical protein AAG906_011606 [Vitis piasezkii]
MVSEPREKTLFFLVNPLRGSSFTSDGSSFLVQDTVCLGKASSSSPVTFLICLGPNIQAKGLYTNDIQRFYKVVSDIVHVRQQDMDLSTYIGRIASLKEEFLTLMPFTNGAKAQQIQTDKFFIALTLIGLRLDLESVRDQILPSPLVPSLDDVFACLLRLSSTQTLSTDGPSDSSILASQTNSRGGHSGNRGRGQRPRYMDGLLALPTLLGHLIFCYLNLTPLQAPHLRVSPLLPDTSASIASIAQTGNVSVCFTQSPSLGPWILDSRASYHISDGKTIGIGRESQGLYHLTSPSSPTTCISTDVPLLIHSRLGHSSLSKFQKMVPRFSTLSSLACESCQLGKHTRVSFPKRLNNRTKSPFELVHTDVWGPCRTASTLGFQYFVTFIDDYSRSCYLINRMPSSILHYQIPHSLLFPTQPLYFLPPRVFGCTCFVHTLTPGQDKLSAKAMKCIFLGYSRLQKGYHCYSPDTHHYFLSIDVTFFEDSPFFSSSKSLPISEVLCALSSSSVCHHRHHVVAPPLSSTEVPDDSPPVPAISPTPTLSSTDHLPIALRKALVRHFLILGDNRQWLMKWLLCTPMAHGILFLYLLVNLQQHIFNHFQTKDLGKLKYCLGLEIAQSSSKCETPGQGMLYEDRGHTQIVGYMMLDWAGSPSDRRSTSMYCSKKQDVVARSSTEAEYRVMALATCELIWLRQLFQELRFGKEEQIKLVCDNQAAIHIASNPIFHEMTKHIEVDCHFIREKIASGCVATSFVNSNDQLADIFTKSLRGPRIKYICNKLGAYDMYAPA